jgi:hypothetical protein
MADLHHTWADVFQAPGTTVWHWGVGEREHYWGFSFRPLQANEVGVQVMAHTTSSGNDLRHTDNFTVTVASGGTYRLSAIWVVGG